MACRIFGAKPEPELMLTYSELDSQEYISVFFLFKQFNSPSRYLNQCWNIAHSKLLNKLQRNLNRNAHIFIQENASETVVSNVSAFVQSLCIISGVCRKLEYIQGMSKYACNFCVVCLVSVCTCTCIMGGVCWYKCHAPAYDGSMHIYMLRLMNAK